MKPRRSSTAHSFLADSQRILAKEYLPHIVSCLQMLSEEEIWWRPNEASNSAGNLVLHLSGNVRQWIIANLGGAEDLRERDLEFSERGPIAREDLITRIRSTVQEACKVLGRIPESLLAKKYTIQGLHVTGLEVVAHVGEHFAYHAGQIIYITKLIHAQDLKFTRLPAVQNKKAAAKAAS